MPGTRSTHVLSSSWLVCALEVRPWFRRLALHHSPFNDTQGFPPPSLLSQIRTHGLLSSEAELASLSVGPALVFRGSEISPQRCFFYMTRLFHGGPNEDLRGLS